MEPGIGDETVRVHLVDEIANVAGSRCTGDGVQLVVLDRCAFRRLVDRQIYLSQPPSVESGFDDRFAGSVQNLCKTEGCHFNSS